MALKLYYHPLASYCWKVLIALYESETPFEAVLVNLGEADHRALLSKVWPLLTRSRQLARASWHTGSSSKRARPSRVSFAKPNRTCISFRAEPARPTCDALAPGYDSLPTSPSHSRRVGERLANLSRCRSARTSRRLKVLREMPMASAASSMVSPSTR